MIRNYHLILLRIIVRWLEHNCVDDMYHVVLYPYDKELIVTSPLKAWKEVIEYLLISNVFVCILQMFQLLVRDADIKVTALPLLWCIRYWLD